MSRVRVAATGPAEAKPTEQAQTRILRLQLAAARNFKLKLVTPTASSKTRQALGVRSDDVDPNPTDPWQPARLPPAQPILESRPAI